MLSTVQSTSTEVKDAISLLKQSIDGGIAGINDETNTKLEGSESKIILWFWVQTCCMLCEPDTLLLKNKAPFKV